MIIDRNANFSPCHSYRYALWRHWGGAQDYVMFVGLNPSMADETQDDPTIRRCLGFARDWGYSGLCVTNLFAFRATYSQDLKNAHDPVGQENDEWLCNAAKDAALIVAAWGVQGNFQNRDSTVRQLLPNLHYLRLTKGGFPEHPLYLPKTLRPVAWP